MESTAFTKVWSLLMLSVNAVIMICVRNCRISFTLIVLFPLLLLGDRGSIATLSVLPHPECTSIAASKASMATTAANKPLST
jgi:hypothetical protein